MGKIVELDVREDFKQKLDPFQKIMDAIQPLTSGDTFILQAPIEPMPLLTVLKGKGFSNKVEKIAENHYKVTFVKE